MSDKRKSPDPSPANLPHPSLVSAQTARQRVNSADLLAGAKEVVIEHVGDEYRLRLTSQGKLILTK